MSDKDEQDLGLVRQAIAGDNKAYWSLIEGNKRLVYSVCNKAFKKNGTGFLKKHAIGARLEDSPFSNEGIDDIANAIFLYVYNNLSKFRGESKFSTWLYAVAETHCKRVCAEVLKERKRVVKVDIEDMEKKQRSRFLLSDSQERIEENSDGSAVFEEEMGSVNPGDIRKEDNQDSEDKSDAFKECVQSKIAMLDEKHRAVVESVHYAQRTYDEAAEIFKCPIGTIRSRLSRALEKLKPLVRECLALRRG